MKTKKEILAPFHRHTDLLEMGKGEWITVESAMKAMEAYIIEFINASDKEPCENDLERYPLPICMDPREEQGELNLRARRIEEAHKEWQKRNLPYGSVRDDIFSRNQLQDKSETSLLVYLHHAMPPFTPKMAECVLKVFYSVVMDDMDEVNHWIHKLADWECINRNHFDWIEKLAGWNEDKTQEFITTLKSYKEQDKSLKSTGMKSQYIEPATLKCSSCDKTHSVMGTGENFKFCPDCGKPVNKV